MELNEAKELLEDNGYILEEGIFDSIKNKFFKKKEVAQEVKPMNKKLYDDQIEKTSQQAYNHTSESKVNKAIKLLESVGYIVEDTEDDEMDAAFYDWDAEFDHDHLRANNPEKAEELGARYFKLRNKRMTLLNKIAMAKLNHLKKLLIDAGFETATVSAEDDDYERPILSFYYGTPTENKLPFQVYINFDKETGDARFYCFTKNYHYEFETAEKLVKHFR